jgi:DNA-binding CsgD family transcriptional regulator
MKKTRAPEVSGALSYTTKRREWWGWFGSISWMFFMMYGHDTFMTSELAYHEGGTIHPFLFMVVFSLSLIAFGWRFGREPNELAKIAFYTTPIALLFTVVFALLPSPIGVVLFILSPIFFAPAMIRRVYGVLHTSEPGKRITRYMSGIAACVTLFTVWMIIEPPSEVAFLIPALLAVPAWIGVRRSVSLTDALPEKGAFKTSTRFIILLISALIILFWFDLMTSMIHANIINTGIDESNPLYLILGFILPPVGFMIYSFVHDRGRERLGFICGMSLCIIGVILALMPGEVQNAMLIPLAFTDGLGGTYTEFFILTIPMFFFTGAKRPVFAAILGVIVNLISSAYTWMSGVWLPESFTSFSTLLYTSTAISIIIFIMLVYIIFEKHWEKTLAAALYALLQNNTDNNLLPIAAVVATETSSTNENLNTPETQIMINAGLTQEESRIALLLLEGNSRSDILRELRISAAKVNHHVKMIREKLSAIGGLDPVISSIASEHKLTPRETDILRCLQHGQANEEIATELFISEETVKTHLRNLLRKISIENKNDIPEWVETYGRK